MPPWTAKTSELGQEPRKSGKKNALGHLGTQGPWGPSSFDPVAQDTAVLTGLPTCCRKAAVPPCGGPPHALIPSRDESSLDLPTPDIPAPLRPVRNRGGLM